MNRKRFATGAVVGATVLAVAGFGFAAPAQAVDIEREKTGSCSGGASWDLDVEREFGVISVNLDVERGAVGERWTVRAFKNGAPLGVKRVKADYEGDVDVNFITRDQSGKDKIRVKAVSASGQTCAASLRI